MGQTAASLQSRCVPPHRAHVRQRLSDHSRFAGTRLMALMDKSFFDELYRREKKHWWFDCRRRLAAQALRQYKVRQPGRILDMGCGTGAMLDELQPFGTEFGLDISVTALTYCKNRSHQRLALGVGEDLPWHEAAFDGVVSLDVLEHIENDTRTAQNLFRICREGAVVVITV